MHQDECLRAQLQRAADHFPRVDGRVVHRAPRLHLVCKEHALPVEKQHPELLDPLARQYGGEVVGQASMVVEHGLGGHRGPAEAHGRLVHQADRGHAVRTQAFDLKQLRRRRRQDRRITPEPFEGTKRGGTVLAGQNEVQQAYEAVDVGRRRRSWDWLCDRRRLCDGTGERGECFQPAELVRRESLGEALHGVNGRGHRVCSGPDGSACRGQQAVTEYRPRLPLALQSRPGREHAEHDRRRRRADPHAEPPNAALLR